MSDGTQNTAPPLRDQPLNGSTFSKTWTTYFQNVGDLANTSVPWPGQLVQMAVVQDRGDDWLLCDGSNVKRDSYPNLYAAIGISFGQGDGSTTFALPSIQPQASGTGSLFTFIRAR